MSASAVPKSNAVECVDVSPELLEQWLRDGEAVLVDVREDFEHNTEKIEGAVNHPLSKFDPEMVRGRWDGKRIVFHCRSGKRSREAAERFCDGSGPTFHLAGGIEGWKASGRPTQRPSSAPKIDVMRQVQMTAGSLVLIGVILGLSVSPWFLGLSAFVGAGLVFAGASGWCGMAMLLSKMPWNRGAPASSCSL
ncbi:MAG TPA: DUF2892 domain-containing protein [Phycisphaerales bacterium]|nr:DUF2892 domain-containing protein [Phycisphaerales bacterium]